MAASILLSACGGSEINEAATDAGSTVTAPDAARDTATSPNSGVTKTGDTAAGVTKAGDTTAGVTKAGDTTAGATKAGGTTTPTGSGGKASGDTTTDATTKAGNGKSSAPSGVGAADSGSDAGATTTEAAVAKLVASAPMFGGTAACKPATLSEVPIGNVSTLSGVLGELFSPGRTALQLFVTAQNACGGLNGHKIKLFIEDDQGDPTTAFSKGLALAQEKKILAFVGNIEVLTVNGFGPVIKRTGIPLLGSDLTHNDYFTNPLIFPQGSSVQSMGYAMNLGVRDYFKKTKIGLMYCIEVPVPCNYLRQAMQEMGPEAGVEVIRATQVSITAPTFVQQCLDFKNAGVEVVAFAVDAATERRVAKSCNQVGFFPKVVSYPISVGNEKQFFGEEWLGDTYIPMNTFPWHDNETPVGKYYQAMVKKYAPGTAQGQASSLAWTSGALLLAASANLPADNPTTQNLLDTLYTFKGQKFTELGGLGGPKTYTAGQNPKIPYCYWSMVANDKGDGWKLINTKRTCTKVVAPSDPLARS
ncbi:MAG: ABC transporter substrate-binding protein [Sporichthyaceae bacterium]